MEPVHHCAQDLCVLFYTACPFAQQGTQEADLISWYAGLSS